MITTPYLCDDLSMFVTYTIDVEIISKDSQNVPMSIIDIVSFRFVSIYLETPREINANTTTYECDLLINHLISFCMYLWN